MHPKDARSPAWRITGPVRVIHITPDWSLARMTYDDHPAVGIRWNGDLNDRNSLGYPSARGHGAWFILPEGLDELVVAAAKMTPGLDGNLAVANLAFSVMQSEVPAPSMG